jgi:hypothetical protein
MANIRNNKIKFNTLDYPKIPLGIVGKSSKKVVLLQVFVVNKRELSMSFLDYDKVYYKKGKHGNKIKSYYPIPDGKLIILLLLAKTKADNRDSKIFTTIRRWTSQKEEYYKNHLGNTFYIEKSME